MSSDPISGFKARISTVKLGTLSIQGLMDDQLGHDGQPIFYVSASQTAELFQLDKTIATRAVKTLLEADSQLVKIKTNLNPNAVNALTLRDFETVLAKLSFKGNPIAQSMVLALTGLALHQVFCDSFCVEFEKEDRQLWLSLRQESKDLFWGVTSGIQDWMAQRECSAPPHVYYSTTIDNANIVLFGKRSKQIKEELGIGKNALIRDNFGKVAIRNLNAMQDTIARWTKEDPSLDPRDQPQEYVFANRLKPIDYRN